VNIQFRTATIRTYDSVSLLLCKVLSAKSDGPELIYEDDSKKQITFAHTIFAIRHFHQTQKTQTMPARSNTLIV
jgi:hypothetical protein